MRTLYMKEKSFPRFEKIERKNRVQPTFSQEYHSCVTSVTH